MCFQGRGLNFSAILVWTGWLRVSNGAHGLSTKYPQRISWWQENPTSLVVRTSPIWEQLFLGTCSLALIIPLSQSWGASSISSSGTTGIPSKILPISFYFICTFCLNVTCVHLVCASSEVGIQSAGAGAAAVSLDVGAETQICILWKMLQVSCSELPPSGPHGYSRHATILRGRSSCCRAIRHQENGADLP